MMFHHITLTREGPENVAERIVNTRLYNFLKRKGILSNEQAGFRKACRTEYQLFRLDLFKVQLTSFKTARAQQQCL